MYEQTNNMSTCQRSQDTKKKKPRSVRALSTAQLAHKRASDREAQRLFRQRTREHITSLQQKADKSDRTEQLLEQTLQRNANLEAERLALHSELMKVTCMLEEQQRQDAHALAWTSPYGGNYSDGVPRQDALARLSIGDVGPCLVGTQNQLLPDYCQSYDLSGISLCEFDIFAADSGLEKMNV